VEAVRRIYNEHIDVFLVGNTNSAMFPRELLEFTTSDQRCHRVQNQHSGKLQLAMGHWQSHRIAHRGDLSINDWALQGMGSQKVSRIDMVLRWGGRRRLSGFLPIQTVYSDLYIFDECWPDYQVSHLHEALGWHQEQDVTWGG
jgi:undecaprenyl diphosphate synthase